MLALQGLADPLRHFFRKCRHLAGLDGIAARVDDHGAVSPNGSVVGPHDGLAQPSVCILTRLEVAGKTQERHGKESGAIVLRRGRRAVGGPAGRGSPFSGSAITASRWTGSAIPSPIGPIAVSMTAGADRQGRFWAGSMHDPQGSSRTLFRTRAGGGRFTVWTPTGRFIA